MFQTTPTTHPKKFPPGSIPEARFLPDHDLIFAAKSRSSQLFITCLSPDSVVHHPEGTTLWRGDSLLAARLPDADRLPSNIATELLRIYFEFEKLKPFLMRGEGVASVAQNFVITGLKCDNNSKLLLPHVHSCPDTATRARMAWGKLSSVFRRHILPVVHRYFAVLFAPLLRWVSVRKLPMYAMCLSAATFGRLFWPRSHVDVDAWYTILVCLDIRSGVLRGGDFAFAQTGTVLKCSHGDILVFNGRELHGTTEFEVRQRSNGRVYVAFFLKKDSLRASALSAALFARTGIHSIALDDVHVEVAA